MDIKDRGFYALLNALILMASGLFAFGMPAAIIKIVSSKNSFSVSLLRKIFLFFIAQIFITIICMLFVNEFYLPVRDIFNKDVGILILSIVIVNVLILKGILQSFILGKSEFNNFQISKLLPVILLVLFTLLLSIGSPITVFNLLAIWFFSEFLALLFLFISVYKTVVFCTDGKDDSFQSIFIFGVKGMVGQSTLIDNYKLDQLICGLILSIESVAIYSVAKSVALSLRFVGQSLSQIAFVEFLTAKNIRSSFMKYQFVAVIVSFISMGLALGLFNWLVLDYLDDKYQGILPLIFILMLAVVFSTPRRIIYEYWRAVGNPGKSSMIEVLLVFVYVLLLIFIREYSVINFGSILMLSNFAILLLVVNWVKFDG